MIRSTNQKKNKTYLQSLLLEIDFDANGRHWVFTSR